MHVDALPHVAERLADLDDPVALLEGLFAQAPVAFEVFSSDVLPKHPG
jgi:hypothetical protein